MEDKFKRINILIRPDQHDNVAQSGLSLSGLMRDLLDARFDQNRVTLYLSEKSKKLYDHIVSNYGVGDEELERFFVEALDKFLAERSNEIAALREKLSGPEQS